MTRDRLVEILHEVRKKCVCHYTGPMCDCKFGGKHINNPFREDNGCPELFLAAAIIHSMTEQEFQIFYNRTGQVTP